MARRDLGGEIRAVHFVGIGGSGMSALAELLLLRGYDVSGSDVATSPTTDRLGHLGARVFAGHAADHVGTTDMVVYSSAIRPENPELVEAHKRGIRIMPRGEMLAELMRPSRGIAVAGAHGKTTTSSMIAMVLTRAGLDPTVAIGARVEDLGSNARLGRGPYFIAEADESDRSFLMLRPSLVVMTNIDVEHLESYRDFADLQEAFAQFANLAPADATVVACADDVKLKPVLTRITRRIVTYGIEDPSADVFGGDVRTSGLRASCQVRHRGRPLGELRLNIPGRHNVQNALAATAAARELGVAFDVIAEALERFRGAARRFEVKGSAGGVMVVDDYGHHPTEIQAVLTTARAVLPDPARGRLIVAFQPHRYTRTRQLMDLFGPALGSADIVILTDIYSAGEDPLPEVSIEKLAGVARGQVAGALHLVKRLSDVPARVGELARPGDLVLTLGAGSIGTIGGQILERLRNCGDG